MNVVHVDFSVKVTELSDGTSTEVHENHHMRYLFLPEIENFAEQTGFKLLHSSKWLSDQPLSDKTWYGIAVLVK